MSVIVENEKKEILLFCKGADSILLDLMDKEKNPDIDGTLQYLMEFADEGLRTLLVCSKTITKNHYEAWAKRYLVNFITRICKKLLTGSLYSD